VLNAILGGTMSSRLFQNVRERRGLAYSVYSGMSAYRDTGSTVIYAGCASEAVTELIDVVVAEIRRMKREAVDTTELQRARDNLKGSLMLGLESTSSRMAHLARQAIYFDRQFDLDETLGAIDAVTIDDVQRVAGELFTDDGLSATVLGPVTDLDLPRERLALS
jgi:predicted Zn-dependent peptidase